MQLAWSRIWTCVAVSISYDDNHYTTGYQYINREENMFAFKLTIFISDELALDLKTGRR